MRIHLFRNHSIQNLFTKFEVSFNLFEISPAKLPLCSLSVYICVAQLTASKPFNYVNK